MPSRKYEAARDRGLPMCRATCTRYGWPGCYCYRYVRGAAVMACPVLPGDVAEVPWLGGTGWLAEAVTP